MLESISLPETFVVGNQLKQGSSSNPHAKVSVLSKLHSRWYERGR